MSTAVRRTQVFLLLLSATVDSSTANIKRWGDQRQYIIPVVSAVPTLLLRDLPGFIQIGMTEIVSQTTSEGLKLVAREKKPNGDCCNSFVIERYLVNAPPKPAMPVESTARMSYGPHQSYAPL